MQQSSQYSIYPPQQQQGGRDVRREPPPYPGYNRYQQAAGYRQSYASSETGSTDMSLSSCENLSTSMRQDPQGEETQCHPLLSSPIDMAHPAFPGSPPGVYMPAGSPTTMEVKSANCSTFYVTGSQVDGEHGDVIYHNATGESTGGQPNNTGFSDRQYYSEGNNSNNHNMYISPPPAQPVIQPQQYTPQHYSSTTPSPQSASKQDPFKKWRHFYVNQKTQLQQYKFFQQANEHQGSEGEERNYHYHSGAPHYQQYVNDPPPPGTVNRTAHIGGGTSGSMIAKLKQEFCMKQTPNNQVNNNNNDELNTRLAPQPPTDRVRSQTPDFLSERPSVSRQLPMRPSSANSKQKPSDRPLSFLKMKAHKQLQAKQKSESSVSSTNTVQDDSDSQEVDNNANQIAKFSPSNKEQLLGESAREQLAVCASRVGPTQPRSALPYHTDTHTPNTHTPNTHTTHTPNTHTPNTHTPNTHPPNTHTPNTHTPNTHPPNTHTPNTHTPNTHPPNTHTPNTHTPNTHTPNTHTPNTHTPNTQRPYHTDTSTHIQSTDNKQRSYHTDTTSHLQSTDNAPHAYHADTHLQSTNIAPRCYDVLDTIAPPVSSMQKGNFSSSTVGSGCSKHDLSTSQPDLSHLVGGLSVVGDKWPAADAAHDNIRVGIAELDHAAIATRATQMVERLSEENRSLRHELEGYYSKVCRLQKFEVEIQKVTDAYELLEKHSTKRENLEKVMRLRLETETKKLRENNQDLKGQLEKTLLKIDSNGGYALTSDTETKRELKDKDLLITKLLRQNRELSTIRDKLEVDLASHKCRCEENTNHIEILDQTLKNSQRDKLKMEEEMRGLRSNEGKLLQLQSALTQLQAAAERRESIEQKLRCKLEEEVRVLKTNKLGAPSDTDEGISSGDCDTVGSRWVPGRQGQDTQVLGLQAQVAHLQQKMIEEAALRQFAVDAAQMPKDARIAALEQNSHETERLILEARSERLSHLDELHAASRQGAELQAKVKTLTAHLAEKEAMLQVLQKQSFSLSRTNSLSSLFSSPLHSPHTSSAGERPATAGARMALLSRPTISPVLTHRELTSLTARHAKSNSEGAVLDLSGGSEGKCVTSPSTSQPPATTTATTKSLRQLLEKQQKLFASWQSEQPDDLTKECWQV